MDRVVLSRPIRRAVFAGAAFVTLVVVTALASGGSATAAPTAPVADQERSSDRTCADSHGPGPGWRLSWHDEFGKKSLDRSSWNTVMDFPGRAGGHYHNTSYGSYALDENIVLGGGRLHLVTDNKPVTGDDPAGTYQYSEGFIASHDKFYQAYGYWEICAKYPAGRGLWPAFWLVPQDRTWPPEFDIAEWFGGNTGMFQGIASGEWPDVQWNGQWTYDTAPTAGWHTYALLWEPGRAVFSIDGHPTGSFEGSYVPDKPMYVVLNSGVWMNADRGGPPDASTVFPNTFDVDYVRVYEQR